MSTPAHQPRPSPTPHRHASRETVLGIRWDNLLVQEALGAVEKALERWQQARQAGERGESGQEGRESGQERREPGQTGAPPQLVHFLNLDCLRLSQEDSAYREALERADWVLPDGVGFEWVVRMFGSRMRENCRGTDFAPLALEKAAARGVSVFLLGGREGVAREAGERLRWQIPGLRVAGARDGYFARSAEAQTAEAQTAEANAGAPKTGAPHETEPKTAEQEVIEQVNGSGAGLLLVGMGAPLQEIWLERVRERLEVGVAMGVGGFMDVASGRIARAPGWLIAMRLEWLWRVAMEPRRLFRRYFVDGPAFLARVVRKRFAS